mmetsp:Transcript_48833/g.122297  ORF Transcript_48833/g.122297 Transcript_48833/m.122297 type:complete len:89 (-) Transcript_48833:890-1156(-)
MDRPSRPSSTVVPSAEAERQSLTKPLQAGISKWDLLNLSNPGLLTATSQTPPMMITMMTTDDSREGTFSLSYFFFFFFLLLLLLSFTF